MKIIDGFLQPAELIALRDGMLSSGFPWQCVPILSSGASPDMAASENLQWVHGFVHWQSRKLYRSPALPMLEAVADRLGPVRLLRVKANLTRPLDRHLEYGLHVDVRRPGASTGILYLNDNNGYTVFEDGTRVQGAANRFVEFDASLRHTGASCTDAPYRLVLNLNWLGAKD